MYDLIFKKGLIPQNKFVSNAYLQLPAITSFFLKEVNDIWYPGRAFKLPGYQNSLTSCIKLQNHESDCICKHLIKIILQDKVPF